MFVYNNFRGENHCIMHYFTSNLIILFLDDEVYKKKFKCVFDTQVSLEA